MMQVAHIREYYRLVLTSSNRLSTLLQRFACARLSRPCLPGSCPDVSATFTTTAFSLAQAALRSRLAALQRLVP
jgi:hypothetical protein